MAALPLGAAAAAAQDELDNAIEKARFAWLEHDIPRMLRGSDTVRLHLPGVAQAYSVRPAQASRILSGFLRLASELSLTLRDIRKMGEGHAYAELERRYVVRGTAEERIETVYIGFRRVGGVWTLREIRVAP